MNQQSVFLEEEVADAEYSGEGDVIDLPGEHDEEVDLMYLFRKLGLEMEEFSDQDIETGLVTFCFALFAHVDVFYCAWTVTNL